MHSGDSEHNRTKSIAGHRHGREDDWPAKVVSGLKPSPLAYAARELPNTESSERNHAHRLVPGIACPDLL
jgi:hypothetical protein